MSYNDAIEEFRSYLAPSEKKYDLEEFINFLTNTMGNTELYNILKEDKLQVFKIFINNKNNLKYILKEENFIGVLFILLENGSINIFNLLSNKYKMLDLLNTINADEILHHVMIGYYNFMNNNEKSTNNIPLIFQNCIINKIDMQKHINECNSYNTTLLFEAIISKNVELIDFLITKCGADINLPIDINGTRIYPIHIAIMTGDVKIVEFLFKKGVNMNQTLNLPNTKIHPYELVFTLDKTSEFDNFFKKIGIKTNSLARISSTSKKFFNEINNNFLIWAVDFNNLLFTRFLIENYDMNLNIKDKYGYTPLHIACECGNLPIVQCLVEKGADIEEKDECRRNFLHLVCKQGNLPIAQYLIEKGVNIEEKDDEGKTPLHTVCEYPYITTINLLPVAQCLILEGADIEARDNREETPLHLAASHDNLFMVIYLVKNGADMEARDKNRRTPYMLASNREFDDNIISYLKGEEEDEDLQYSIAQVDNFMRTGKIVPEEKLEEEREYSDSSSHEL